MSGNHHPSRSVNCSVFTYGCMFLQICYAYVCMLSTALRQRFHRLFEASAEFIKSKIGCVGLWIQACVLELMDPRLGAGVVSDSSNPRSVVWACGAEAWSRGHSLFWQIENGLGGLVPHRTNVNL